MVTDKLALKLYGSYDGAIGQDIKLSGGLPFTIVGVFKENVDTFGQSEIQEDSMLIQGTSVRRCQSRGSGYREATPTSELLLHLHPQQIFPIRTTTLPQRPRRPGS